MQRMMLALVLALAGASCSSSMPGPAGTSARYDWVRGRLEGVLAGSLPDVEQAARRACAELDLVAVVETSDSRTARIEARMATGTKVRVALVALPEDRTLVRIRVGDIGDRAVSMQLLRHISDHVRRSPGSSA